MSQTTLRVAAPPEKPLLIFDGACTFCSLWVQRWQRFSHGAFDCVPLLDPGLAARFPELTQEQFERAVHFISTDGSIFVGAEAVFHALACHSNGAWLMDWYRQSPAFARSAEAVYGFVAGHRGFFSFFTRLLWGRQVQPPSYAIVRWLFLRALGLIYLAAFLSLWPQVTGLIGNQGIIPAEQTMSAVRSEMDLQHMHIQRYQLVPTLCWFNAKDSFLKFQCGAGALLAILLVVDIAPVPCLFLLWLLYLSLVIVGRDFLGFQWDNLLLETGLFAIFLAPLQLLPHRLRAQPPPPRFAIWLLRWLLFQLMFESGCVKLLSRDPSWRNLTALEVHYETQPLPTWIGWYAHQLPAPAQKLCCAAMFAIELGLPWLIFAPRRPRQLACFGFALLQVCILLTGNYCFFNYLTLALALLLLDDAALEGLLSGRWLARFSQKLGPARADSPPRYVIASRLFHFCGFVVAGVAVVISLILLAGTFGIRGPLPHPMVRLCSAVAPLRSFNSYGLFAVMTVSRSEISVEGSQDGAHWLPYEFNYKPGPLGRRPGFVAPHQPRLDWQMWFAALGSYRDNRNQWFLRFCGRLLAGSPPVLGLLERNPFPLSPPRYIRAVLYDYRFTDLAARHQTGDWWQRQPLGLYLPPVSLSDFSGN